MYYGELLRFAHAQTGGHLGEPIVGAQRSDPIVETHRFFLQRFTLGRGAGHRITQAG